MKTIIQTILGLAMLVFTGCESAPAPMARVDPAEAEKAKQVAIAHLTQLFDAARDGGFTEKGTGSLAGQAFLKTRGGDVKVGAGNIVMLIPVTPWFEAVTNLKGSLGGLPGEQNAVFAKGIRTNQADAEGKFEFTNLPPGLYKARTLIIWEVPSAYGMRTTGGKVEAQAIVKNGEQTKVMLTE